ncbi:hypothetical protein HDU89_002447 [Geranomyces variabilis]|nr:hypothetical protein HDU89_002447 [Geranomyces variabilis]
MLASSAPHSPSTATAHHHHHYAAAATSPAISDSLLRQDSKDAITKSTHLVKLIGKHRIALGSVAQTMADMGDALADLGRARAVRVAERSTPHSLNRDAMRHCGEFHVTMAKRIREYTDRILRELEEPLQSSIDEHAHTVTSNEKRLAQMEREISDKVKKSEVRTKKKWNRDAAQAEQATRDLARYTLELSDLKFHNQNIIVGEEARHVRVMEDQWAALLRSLSGLLGKSLNDASACFEQLSDSSKGSSASSTRKGGLYGNNAPVLASAQRRGSLDSNMGDVNVKPVEEKPSYNSLGRRVAKMVGAVSGSGNSHTPNSSTSSGGSGSTSPRRGAGGERAASPRSNSTSPNGSSGTASPNMSSSSQALGPINTTNLGPGQSAFPQLSLPSFSPLGSAPPSPRSNPLASQEQQHYQPAAAPRPIMKSANSSSNASSSDKQRRVAFPTSKPIATVQQTPDQPITQGDGSQSSPSPQQSLSSLYPDIFAAENTHIAQTPVLAHRAIVRNPAVYVAGGEGDAESQIGSVVGTTESLVGVLPSGNRNLDLVYAIHDFDARSAKEMSLRKGDVMEVKKRHGTWIYGTKFSRRQKASDEANSPASVTSPTARSANDRFRRGIPQDSSAEQTKTEKPEVGWIPMAFVAKFSAA